MIIYIIASILASLIQIITIALLRQNILTSFLYAIPLILIYQFLFLWSYSHAPKFLLIWFITTALTNSLAFILGYFLYHEQISIWNITGIIVIITGIFLLQLK